MVRVTVWGDGAPDPTVLKAHVTVAGKLLHAKVTGLVNVAPLLAVTTKVEVVVSPAGAGAGVLGWVVKLKF
jgi:hypothetical protein